MKIEMICTGEEVLAGQIVDTNAAWLGNRLLEHGYEMSRRTTVGDRLDDLIDVFRERSEFADVILVNGGLGPTADDLSALAMARAMCVELVENTQWSDHLTQWFAARNKTLSASNLKQALLPQGAQMIDNPVGTACGFVVKFNRAWLFFTPGVPHEFKEMVDGQFLPFVKAQQQSENKVQVAKVLTLGMGESAMAERLECLHWPDGITLGYRSYMPYLELKLIARDADEATQAQALQQACEALGDSAVAHTQETLAAEVHRLLIGSGKTLGIAESLTGGMICNQLVAFAGSSRYLKQGVVSYCNAAKVKLLNVSEQTIADKSEVSLECVAQMAAGVASALGETQEGAETDFALATSGMAGPASDTDTMPVGSVVIGVKFADQVVCQHLALSSDRSRQSIRELTTAIALDMLRRAILGLGPVANYEYIQCVDQQSYKFREDSL